jgi:hypothetical protein
MTMTWVVSFSNDVNATRVDATWAKVTSSGALVFQNNSPYGPVDVAGFASWETFRKEVV